MPVRKGAGKAAVWAGAALAVAQILAHAGPSRAEQFAVGNSKYTVPAGVTRVKVKLAGGGGGSGGADGNAFPGGAGGRGHVVEATLSVTDGQVIDLYVAAGGKGGASGAKNSGGGSGASYGFGLGGNGANAGGTGTSGGGGGGGGGSVLGLFSPSANSTLWMLRAGGGGGGGGSARIAIPAGGDAVSAVSMATCDLYSNGGAGEFKSGDTGGGGGGGGGRYGGTGGTASIDGSASSRIAGTPSQGGTSCQTSSTDQFASGPTWSYGASAAASTKDGPDGYAIIEPFPFLTKAFSAASMKEGESVTLTFTLTNPEAGIAQTGLSFTDTLSGGLVLTGAPTTTCGGTVTVTEDKKKISLSGGSLLAAPLGGGSKTCTVTAMVTTAASQGPVECTDTNTTTTNGRANVSGLSANLTNAVTRQCVAITPGRPTVTIAKVSEGRTGTFTFKGTSASGNGFPTDGSYSVATTAAGTSATGPQVTLAAAGVGTAIEETLAPGWRLTAARCEDLNWQQSGNPRGKAIGSVSDGRTLTIPAANAREGAKLSCTFTNSFVGFTLSGRVIGDNGAGGGTAHNGLRDGGEAGLGGVPVRFTDCGATTFAGTLTAGDGTFSLPLAGPAAGASVCVVRDAVTDLTGVSGKAGNTGGTVATPGYDAVAFTLAANSSYSGVVFGAIANPALATDGTASVAPGATVFLAHRYSATTTGNVSFSIANATGQPGLSAFTYTLMRDADCSGTLEASEPAVSGAIGVAAGDEVCLIVRVQASAGAAAGAALEYDVTAETALSGTLAVLAALTDHDVVTVSGGGTITLVKRVRNVTSGSGFAVTSAGGPGDILEYRITFTNPSAEAVSNVSVYDETPAYTSLAVPPGATVVATPSGMNCTMVVPAGGGSNGYTGPLQWKCTGTMPPGGTGRVAFRAKIAD
ncbi:prealbumin-like fold domain-containing protein [Sinorhizobium meliloti]|uniref:prealbumin-like fold domain-containing protein n=1 Tax=Rhizobium meliloti TaxID=382 RepID=UPI003DA0CB13